MAKPFPIISKIKELFDALTAETLSGPERSQRRQDLVASFKARSDRNRTQLEQLADEVASVFGSIGFILLHIVWFGGWIAWNNGWIEGLTPFDPFPYGLLTMLVSLEAIFLSSFVLLSQSRSAKVADLREDVDLNINVQTELEVTKLLHLVDEIHSHLGLRKHRDRELEQLKRRTDVGQIEASIIEATAAAQMSSPDPIVETKPARKSKR